MKLLKLKKKHFSEHWLIQAGKLFEKLARTFFIRAVNLIPASTSATSASPRSRVSLSKSGVFNSNDWRICGKWPTHGRWFTTCFFVNVFFFFLADGSFGFFGNPSTRNDLHRLYITFGHPPERPTSTRPVYPTPMTPHDPHDGSP